MLMPEAKPKASIEAAMMMHRAQERGLSLSQVLDLQNLGLRRATELGHEALYRYVVMGEDHAQVR